MTERFHPPAIGRIDIPEDIKVKEPEREGRRMGGLVIAQRSILKTTITIQRLKQRGYISLSDQYNIINL
ncbi:MAG: hypothetical protein IPG12_04955 [Saprospiraceae bacterium]|nr:hypothetical protein [Saprospiraceae bacterium]